MNEPSDLTLKIEVGSTLHGTGVAEQDDLDLMGVVIPPPASVLGLDNSLKTEMKRTQPEGKRSGPGDVDYTVYLLRHFADLARKGNPSILLPLFAPQNKILFSTWEGDYLLKNKDLFLSKECAPRFLGYIKAQRDRYLGNRGQARMPKRPELIAQYGYDTKYVYHMFRLAVQGYELLSTGKVTLPMPDAEQSIAVNIRLGRYREYEACEWVRKYEERLKSSIDNSPLPDHPDNDGINEMLIFLQLSNWGYNTEGP